MFFSIEVGELNKLISELETKIMATQDELQKKVKEIHQLKEAASNNCKVQAEKVHIISIFSKVFFLQRLKLQTTRKTNISYLSLIGYHS